MSDYFGKEVFKLGFGLMRLPQNADGSINVEETSAMVDKFIAAGGTYFDTAFVYGNGESEIATRKALVERYPRDKYTLCTKLCAWQQCHDEASAKQQFYTSLERTGAGYFDYYLLHALQQGNYKKYDEYHIWDFVKELKQKGLVKYFGFSFHASPALLEELLKAHPEVDFVQLQINYADWDNPDVASRECYEIARKHGKSITIMEPVKGGALANPPHSVKDVFNAANPKASYASWAIRYAASLDGIITVLSGMSNVAQMEDNLSYMTHFKPLSAAEQAVIVRAQDALKNISTIACTACHYCTDGCPKNIPIPEIFAARNRHLRELNAWRARGDYQKVTHGVGKASDCIRCGQCEGACPQQLKITDLLNECVENLE
ncbi:MAG: aldo/keto reductase [Clostridiales bacterium]|nr:aldo/keto reductase [Clostridiales bacterium]